jgi:putative acetyltransferase
MTYRFRVEIIVDGLDGPEIAAFLGEHIEEMRSTTPLESKHALDLDALRQPGITFWSAYDGGVLVGCGAIKRLDDDHAELKSMRTAPDRKRSGVASAILDHILGEARRMGFARISLETGSADFFRPARGLYEKYGFTYCEPFADYVLDPNSVFMTRTL